MTAFDQRDDGGRVVREAWVRWALTQPNPKPSWLVPYDELSEADKEADRQIFEACRSDLGDKKRIDWIESQVQQYGNGHDEPCEASWHFQWQQEKPADYWPGLREWIDSEMSGTPCLECHGDGGDRWLEADGSENGEKCPRCGGFGSEP